MKRHFLTGLKAFAVGALAFAAVSCYDDQPIWDEIEGLKDRVTALEEKLNTEVATINTTLGTLKAADEKLADFRFRWCFGTRISEWNSDAERLRHIPACTLDRLYILCLRRGIWNAGLHCGHFDSDGHCSPRADGGEKCQNAIPL